METQYLPPISTFVRMWSFYHITIDGEENFRKSTWRNRCRIINANGSLLLTIPIIGGRGVRTQTKEVHIANDQPWQRIHWRSIVAAYGKSPFFIFYEEKFRRMYEQRFEFLMEFNTSLLRVCFEILQWEKVILKNNSLQSLGDNQTRNLSRKTGEVSGGRNIKPYHQVFEGRHGFIADLSILDLIFNLGNEASVYLESTVVTA